MTTQTQPQDGVAELGAASDVTRGYAGGPFENWLFPDMQDDPH